MVTPADPDVSVLHVSAPPQDAIHMLKDLRFMARYFSPSGKAEVSVIRKT